MISNTYISNPHKIQNGQCSREGGCRRLLADIIMAYQVHIYILKARQSSMKVCEQQHPFMHCICRTACSAGLTAPFHNALTIQSNAQGEHAFTSRCKQQGTQKPVKPGPVNGFYLRPGHHNNPAEFDIYPAGTSSTEGLLPRPKSDFKIEECRILSVMPVLRPGKEDAP